MAEGVDTRKHAKFSKNFCDYASQYGVTDRTIRRWVRVGKQSGVPVPLDTPAEMAGWCARVIKRRVPDGLLQFAPPPPDTPTPPSSDSPPEPDQPPRDFANVESLDLAASVIALQRTHAINAHLLEEAFKGRDEALIALRQRNLKDSFTLLRQGEAGLDEVLKQRGKMIDREAVEVEIAQVLESLRVMREAMPRRIIAELEKILPRRISRVLTALERFLIPAIEKVRIAEEEIFRNLRTLDGGREQLRELIAA